MEVRGLQELEKALANMDDNIRKVISDAFTFSGGKIKTLAQEYCPISPTQAQRNRLRKTTRKVTRKATATTRAKPGGLRRSIDFEVDQDALTLSVFVADNSEGARYAAKIHDEQGASWNNLGPGSRAATNSENVGGKFIERAVQETEEDVYKYLEAKLKRVQL